MKLQIIFVKFCSIFIQIEFGVEDTWNDFENLA